jgi:hypothetical protein
MNKNLISLKQNNPGLEIEQNEEGYRVVNPWFDESVNFAFKKRQNLTQIANVKFPEELVAIFHKDKQLLEFIFAPIEKEEFELNRKDKFNFQGVEFSCYYSEQTKALELLSKSFVIGSTDTESGHRNLPVFRNFYRKNDIYQKFFKNAEPLSYFVQGDFKKICNNFVLLSKTLNFYRFYFKRTAPQILILKKKVKKQKYTQPCYSKKQPFPRIINAKEINPTLLEIFGVARETSNIRLKFIFYYQILEFASYYYLNNKVQNKLSSLLKQPDVSSNAAEYSKKVIEELKDHFSVRDDSSKLESTITDYCSIEDIKAEIECNYEYFSEDIEFDGGLSIPKILKNKDGIACLTDGDIVKVKKNIEKIRNVLVHLRESRENKVILPTAHNNNLLIPYLYIIKRIAEKVAIQFE